MKSQMEWE